MESVIRMAETSNLHINWARGYYIGQVRSVGCRKWDTVTGRCQTAESALSRAALKMRHRKRARALFVDTTGYYDPHVSIEATR